MPQVSELLTEKLIKEGDVTLEESEEIHKRLRRHLDASREGSHRQEIKHFRRIGGSPSDPLRFAPVQTAVKKGIGKSGSGFD